MPFGLIGTAAVRALFQNPPLPASALSFEEASFRPVAPLSDLLPALEAGGHGVILTMGKGGVGKTSVAVSVAVELARHGHAVHLTTTDPAAHVAEALGESVPGLRVSRIDPAHETLAYSEEVLRTAGANLDSAGTASARLELVAT
jgi:arsenite-transporting ATPase